MPCKQGLRHCIKTSKCHSARSQSIRRFRRQVKAFLRLTLSMTAVWVSSLSSSIQDIKHADRLWDRRQKHGFADGSSLDLRMSWTSEPGYDRNGFTVSRHSAVAYSIFLISLLFLNGLWLRCRNSRYKFAWARPMLAKIIILPRKTERWSKVIWRCMKNKEQVINYLPLLRSKLQVSFPVVSAGVSLRGEVYPKKEKSKVQYMVSHKSDPIY